MQQPAGKSAVTENGSQKYGMRASFVRSRQPGRLSVSKSILSTAASKLSAVSPHVTVPHSSAGRGHPRVAGVPQRSALPGISAIWELPWLIAWKQNNYTACRARAAVPSHYVLLSYRLCTVLKKNRNMKTWKNPLFQQRKMKLLTFFPDTVYSVFLSN